MLEDENRYHTSINPIRGQTRAGVLEGIKKYHRAVVLFYACVRQNLVFKSLFGSVSDDKYFLYCNN